MRDGFVNVGPVDDFREGRGKAVDVEGVTVGIYRVGESWHALKDCCPPMGASLCEGRLNGRAVVCHWHGWEFDLESGLPYRPSKKRATTSPVESRDGAVCVDSPGAETDAAEDEWVAFDPDKHPKQ